MIAYLLKKKAQITETATILINKVFALDNSTTGFTNSGWTINYDSISATGTGSISTYYQNADVSFLDQVDFSATVKFGSLSTVFSVFRKGGIAGTVAKIDLINNRLVFCEMWNGSNTPVDQYFHPISQTINTTDNYSVTISKRDGNNYLKIKNLTTNEEDVISHDNGLSAVDADGVGVQWGLYGIAHMAGAITCYAFNVSTPFPATPLYACYGDSITEGNSLRSLGNDYDDRWCAKLLAHNNGDGLISGQGGATSTDLVARFAFDFQKINPENTVIFIGANDTVYATWQSNINNLIAQAVAKGSQPIICTLLPRDDRQPFLNQANSYILNTLSATCTIWDFSAVLTVGGDRIIRNSSYFLADNIHPNNAGHEALWQYILTQI